MRLQRLTRKNAAVAARSRDEARVFVVASPEEQQHFIELHQAIRGRFVDYAGGFLGRDDALDAVADTMAILWERWATLFPAPRLAKGYP